MKHSWIDEFHKYSIFETEMRRFIYILLALLALIITCYFGLRYYGVTHHNEDSFLNRHAAQWFDYNKVEVHTGEGIAMDKIKIVHRESGETVFEHGKNQKGELNVEGMTSFGFYYADSLISEIAHWRTNDWHVNTYHFDVYHTEDGVDAILKIHGPDSANVIYYVNER
ncbi:MAG: hypothetical protein C0592_11760 [Marinilabiliales bacterium]|nr:MAG: hypothetical protein C0592_11760 [Marinilabiliales bacterium]